MKIDSYIRPVGEVGTSGSLRMKIKATTKITLCTGNQKFPKKSPGMAIAFDQDVILNRCRVDLVGLISIDRDLAHLQLVPFIRVSG